MDKSPQENLNCPICSKEIYSGTGDGCMMCGMPLEENQAKFCCDTCEEKHTGINS